MTLTDLLASPILIAFDGLRTPQGFYDQDPYIAAREIDLCRARHNSDRLSFYTLSHIENSMPHLIPYTSKVRMN